MNFQRIIGKLQRKIDKISSTECLQYQMVNHLVQIVQFPMEENWLTSTYRDSITNCCCSYLAEGGDWGS